MLTEKQRQFRRMGISGSEIAEVCGLLPYEDSGPHRVWCSKVLGEESSVDNIHTLRGTYLGPAAATWYAARYGYKVTHVGRREKTLQSKKHKLVIATPDGLLRETVRSKPFAVLEIKIPNWRNMDGWGDPGTDQVPEMHIPQAIWEMEASGIRSARFGVPRDGDIASYTVEWDQELFEVLHAMAEKFWVDHVLAKRPPPVDGSKACGNMLGRIYPSASGDKTMLLASREQSEAAARMKEIDDETKRLDKERSFLKQKLSEAIGDSYGIEGNGWKALNFNRAGGINYKKVAEELAGGSIDADLVQRHRLAGGRTFRLYHSKKKDGG